MTRARATHLAAVRDAPAVPDMIVQLTTAQLSAIVEHAVRAALSSADREPAEWLDASAVAEIVNVHPRTVSKLVKREGLPAHRVTEKLLRYQRAEVLAWLARRPARVGRGT